MAHDLIPADVRSRLKDLRLTARRAIGAQGIGVHHSRSRGAGLEFAQYRAYEPGDELRQIDWKLYARSDRFFVREAERESPLTVWIVLDATASMAQRDGARGTRFDAARSLAACIAELALRQGDRFGLLVLHGDGVRLVAPGNGVRQRDQLLLALVPPERVAAISHYSQEAAATSIPLDVARRFRGTAGTAEEVVALKPDLVLASSFTPASTLRAYRKLGLNVLLLDSPTTIAASRDQVRTVATALGEQAAGERLISRIDAAVAAAASKGAARPTALLFIADNFANGGPTLLTEMLGRTGFATPLSDMSRTVPIEDIVRQPPAIILTPDPDGRTATLRRRVLARASLIVTEAAFPRTLINCGGPTIIPAMERLGAIRAGMKR